MEKVAVLRTTYYEEDCMVFFSETHLWINNRIIRGEDYKISDDKKVLK